MPELEEVVLIENPQVPVTNPPAPVAAPVPAAPAETPKPRDENAEIEEDAEENPGSGILNKVNNKITSWTGGVSIVSMGIGAVGIVAAVVVPKLVKFNTGWKDLATTAVLMVVGGYVIGKFSKPFMVAFVMGVGGTLILKLVKWAMNGFKDEPILLDDLIAPGSGQPILNDDFDAGPIYDAADNGLFDVAAGPEDIIHPTAGMDDFY